jgi:UMF1 family MFS transporter
MPLSARLNPFRGLDHPRRVWAWGMFDLANQSFTLLINTLLFGIFFRDVIAGPATDTPGDFYWGLTVSISLAFVVIAGPIVGALADCKVWKKKLLIATAACCVAFTASLALIPAGPSPTLGILLLAMALYIPANVAYNLGENLLAAFLPELCRRENVGRVSAIGWTMGYIGALLLLVSAGVAVATFSLDEPAQWKPLFVFAAAWFALMAVPTFIFLPDGGRPQALPQARTIVSAGFKRVANSIRHARLYRDLALFLCSFLVYAFGVQAVIFFAGIITKSDFGFETSQLVLFTAVITVTAGVGAALTGIVQDRIGHRNTIGLFLFIWTVTSLGLALTTVALDRHVAAGGTADNFPQWPVWVVGNLIGFSLGGIGSASRAMVGFFTPRHRTAEFYGLWGLAYKGAGAVGAIGFGAFRDFLGPVTALLALAAVFAIGGAGVALVNEQRGARQAHVAEQAAT